MGGDTESRATPAEEHATPGRLERDPRDPVAKNGIVQVRQTRFHVTRLLAGQTVYLIETDQHLLVFDDQGTEIMKHRWLRPGTTYVRPGRPRGRQPRTI